MDFLTPLEMDCITHPGMDFITHPWDGFYYTPWDGFYHTPLGWILSHPPGMDFRDDFLQNKGGVVAHKTKTVASEINKYRRKALV